MLGYALEYLKQNKWSIIPLNGKKPLIPEEEGGWKPYQEQLPTEEEVRAWWKRWPKANIGIICGRVSGIVVLDVDGEEGLRSLEGKELPVTTIAQTGKGSHYYFKHPGMEVRNFARKEPGLDFRGDGGYVVAPPSIHPGTKEPYEWAIPPEMEQPTWCPNWLMELLGEKSNGRKGGSGLNPVKILQGIPEGERDTTLFRYACRLKNQGLSKPEMEKLVCSAASNCKPPFPTKDALAKVEQAWKYEGPEVSVLEDITPENVYEEDSLKLLAKAKRETPGKYAEIKQSLKARSKFLNLNDLEKAVKAQMLKSQRMHVVQSDEEPFKLEDILPNIPLELRIPKNWNFTQGGIWQQKLLSNDRVENICACSVPVILTKRLRNIDTGEEKIQLSFFRDNRWHEITSDRATVFNRTTLIQLGNKGLPVSSESSKHLVRYLDELERENLDALPLTKSISHMGWASNKEFLPGLAGDIILDVDEGGAASVAHGYREEGDLESWISFAEPLRDYPMARFMLSAAFAAPLLKILGQRVFVIHNWGPSRGGKTAALKAALSVWGEPDIVMANFNATKVGLERLASFYNDLPLGIDERQVTGDKQGFIESLVYILGLGKGKTRGAKGGGIQDFNYWRTIALTTGEEPLSSASSTAGIKTRVLELYGQPIPIELISSQVHERVKDNFGLAGPAFVRKLLEFIQENPEVIKNDYQNTKNSLTENNPKSIASHIAAVTTICLADYYVSQWIFGLDEEQAGEEANQLMNSIIGMLDSAEEADDGQRAMEYFLSWYGVNGQSFTRDYVKERYGFEDIGILYVFPTIFEKAMKEGGFNPSRILRDWADRNWIMTETKPSDGKRRFKIRKTDGNTGKQTNFVAINLSIVDKGVT